MFVATNVANLPPELDTALLCTVVHAVCERSGEHQKMLYQPLRSVHTDVLFPSADTITLPCLRVVQTGSQRLGSARVVSSLERDTLWIRRTAGRLTVPLGFLVLYAHHTLQPLA